MSSVAVLKTTRQVAAELNVRYSQLYRLLHEGIIPEPARDGSGDFVWDEAAVERAREALADRQSRRRAS